MENTISPFVRKSLEVNNTILEVFNERLSLPPGTLLKLHAMGEFSGSEARVIRNPPTSEISKQAIGSHTDFGSLVHPSTKREMFSNWWSQSFLHNRLGGLQVFVPGAESWQYVKVCVFLNTS